MKSSIKKVVGRPVISFETFRKIGVHEVGGLKREAPDCFNGWVSIEKYKVTIELIKEPKEIYAERLQKLWDECDNYHHWTPLKEEAEKHGIKLEGSPGSKKKHKE